MIPSFGKIRKTAGYFLLELAIIFAGVSGAFFLNTYTEAVKEKENRLIYFKAFYNELEYSETQLNQLEEELKSTLQKYEHSDSAEITINRNLKLDNNLFLLKSAFENESFATAIGSGFMVNISRGTNLIMLLQRHLDILNEESRSYVLRTDKTESSRERFRQWYLEELKYINQLVLQLQKAVSKGAKPATEEIIQELQ